MLSPVMDLLFLFAGMDVFGFGQACFVDGLDMLCLGQHVGVYACAVDRGRTFFIWADVFVDMGSRFMIWFKHSGSGNDLLDLCCFVELGLRVCESSTCFWW